MKVSQSWLQAYVPLELDMGRLTEALTMVGLEVDSVIDRFQYLDSVHVGRVVGIDAHPGSEHLKICQVELHDRNLSVVCGAPNVKSGMLAPLALPGTVLPDGTEIVASSIRGVRSAGMLCSAGELGLGEDFSGVMPLDPSLSVGQPLATALDLADTTIEIDLTPNRPDCLSLLGVAREIAALQGSILTIPPNPLVEDERSIQTLTSVDVQVPDLCPRYTVRLIEAVQVGPSPAWLQDRLMSVGLRPINNIVDITNFVMMETGQPLHAFDFDRLEEHKIIVRSARPGEKFTTLDGKARTLATDAVLICDGLKPVGIGGVMGGVNSEIETTTRRVLLESAYFDPTSIRKTSKMMGLKTDASHRFERGLDPEGNLRALNRAAQLMAEYAGGQVIGGIIDVYPRPVETRTLELKVEATNRLLGTDLGADQIQTLLAAIEFDVKVQDPDTLQVTCPSFRVDVSRPEDLMEEVARLWGYNNIPTTFPRIPAQGSHTPRRITVKKRIRRLLSGLGFNEVINYSFNHPLSCDRLNLPSDDSKRDLVHVLNPISEEQAVMRTSLIPGLLESMHRNVARQTTTLKLFEIGNAYLGRDVDRQPRENEFLAALWTGNRRNPSWYQKVEACDFYDLKGALESFLGGLEISGFDFTAIPEDLCHMTRPGVSAHILMDAKPAGLIGAVHPRVLASFDLKQPAFVLELDLDTLLAHIPEGKWSTPLPRYPAVSRDITVIIDDRVEVRSLMDNICQSNHELVEGLHLFDVFVGKPIAAGRKSISFRITYRSATGTLEDTEVNRIHKAISDRLVREFDADLPA